MKVKWRYSGEMTVFLTSDARTIVYPHTKEELLPYLAPHLKINSK